MQETIGSYNFLKGKFSSLHMTHLKSCKQEIIWKRIRFNFCKPLVPITKDLNIFRFVLTKQVFIIEFTSFPAVHIV